jgi:hypothetical protein
MSNVKERIIGAITVMTENDATYIWNFIESNFAKKSWDSIPEELPDNIDMQMLKDIQNDPECKEFISAKDAMKELGL